MANNNVSNEKQQHVIRQESNKPKLKKITINDLENDTEWLFRRAILC